MRSAWRWPLGMILSALWVASCSSAANHTSTDGGVNGNTDACAARGSCESTGGTCSAGSECASGVCKAGACQAPSPTDGVKNDSETDVDCGGVGSPSSDGAPACADGKTCKAGADYTSTTCQAGKCVPPTCTDKVKDGQETDVDCGGPSCVACPTGDACLAMTDCLNGICTNGHCAAPTDTDHVKNDSETDVDCGGAHLAGGAPNPASDGAPVCAVGKMCLIGLDCVDGVCAAGPVFVDNLDAGLEGSVGDAAVDGGAGQRVCQGSTPFDGVKNASETDVDCGGALLASGAVNPSSDGAPACKAGGACVLTTDCASLVCTAGVCQAPMATDGVKNDSETDVDCGGALLVDGTANASSDGAPACADGKACVLGNDCVDRVCAVGPVTTPSPDGSAIDCPAGQTCTCQTPLPTDGVQNDSETDVDCGGALLADGSANPSTDHAPLCQSKTSQHCLLGSDCDSSVCNSNTAMGPFDLPIPLDCAAGEVCTCQLPAPNDLVKNDSETDVDCGGALSANGAANEASDGAPACATGEACVVGNDCASLVCFTGPITAATKSTNGSPIGCPAGKSCTCQAPIPTDGVQNGGETDVDCGGGAPPGGDGAPLCAYGKACLLASDCSANGCTPPGGATNEGICTLPSCATASPAGITSCGTGETGDPAAVHDSCCTSLVLPTRTTRRLDKYEITAGRYRTFITAAGPNIRSFVTNYVAAKPTSQLAAFVNLNKATLMSLYPAADIFDPVTGAVSDMNLTAHLSFDIDDYNGIRGCYQSEGSYGANTYWQDATHEAAYGSPPRVLPQADADEKSLNCAMPMMFAAFCAWDGGELAVLADDWDAWPSSFPWGATDIYRPNYNWCNGPYGAGGGFTCECDGIHNVGSLGCPIGGLSPLFDVNGQPGTFYIFPTDNDLSLENYPFIAAPGRFPEDATALKSAGQSWHDLNANLVEYTGDFTMQGDDFCDFSIDGTGAPQTCTRSGRAGDIGIHYTNIPRVGLIGNSWEGHQYGRGGAGAWYATGQYGKFGARCARLASAY